MSLRLDGGGGRAPARCGAPRRLCTNDHTLRAVDQVGTKERMVFCSHRLFALKMEGVGEADGIHTGVFLPPESSGTDLLLPGESRQIPCVPLACPTAQKLTEMQGEPAMGP